MNKSELIQRYARTGALTRLNELKAEIAEIQNAFPGLTGDPVAARRGPGRPPASAVIEQAETQAAEAPTRKRKGMSPAQKKAVGVRMKKYWAARKKAEGGKKR